MPRKPVIISTDPGIDDIAAMTIALFAPNLDVRLIVPTWGNVALAYTLQNTLNLEQFLHTSVPVVAGASAPLIAKQISAAGVHGSTGLAGFQFPQANNHLLRPVLAATAMYNEIMDSQQKVTLLGIGPLTDFALLLKQYPNVVEKIAQIVIMGGSLGRGNYRPLAEYNIAGDPEAAQIVLSSHLPVKVAPLEIGQQTHLSQAMMATVKKTGQVGQMLFALFSHLQESAADQQVKVYDPTAVALLLRPDLFHLTAAHMAIELRGQYTYGASVIDLHAEKTNVLVATQVQKSAFAQWFEEAIKRAQQGRA